MIRYCILFLLLSLTTVSLAQTVAADKVTLVASVGKTVYVGDLGNGLLDFGQTFRTASTLGFDYQWNYSYQIGLRYSRGKVGYSNLQVLQLREEFLTRFKYLRVQGSYELNNGIFLPLDAPLRISIPHSLGILRYTFDSGQADSHMGMSLGLSASYPVYRDIAVFYQMGYHWTMFPNLEGSPFPERDRNDHIILHEIGVKYTLHLSDDRDGDGVLDMDDLCPNQIGTAEMNGCPDSDLDGISDREDECIYEPGPASSRGCPDRDGDGVLDKRDKCPDLYGPLATAGCPDSDGDGILDHKDRCPQQAGLKRYQGCPDSDGDGIEDGQDACPNIAGLRSLAGCPDSDRDGVPDSEDECPRISGSVSGRGCPDTDGDGILDKDDRCPSVYGSASKQGCPDDGYFSLQEIDVLAEQIFFSGRSSKLLTTSNVVMDKIASYLKRHPEYKLQIIGHMDAQGDEEENMIHSLERAGEIKAQLVRRGIKSQRIVAKGLGENQAGDGSDLRRDRRIELKVGLR